MRGTAPRPLKQRRRPNGLLEGGALGEAVPGATGKLPERGAKPQEGRGARKRYRPATEGKPLKAGSPEALLTLTGKASAAGKRR